MKRALVQVISAMAHHGYLEQPGGEAMMEFLVRQCALPSDTVSTTPAGVGALLQEGPQVGVCESLSPCGHLWLWQSCGAMQPLASTEPCVRVTAELHRPGFPFSLL